MIKYLSKEDIKKLIELAESLPTPNYEFAMTEEKIFIIPTGCDKSVKVVIE